jgi:hypothetical protein
MARRLPCDAVRLIVAQAGGKLKGRGFRSAGAEWLSEKPTVHERFTRIPGP